MNNMYEYLVGRAERMQKRASAPVYSRNVVNVLRKVAEDFENPWDSPGDEEVTTQAMERAQSGAIEIPHNFYVDEEGNFDPSRVRAWKRMLVSGATKGFEEAKKYGKAGLEQAKKYGKAGLDWAGKNKETLGITGAGMGLGGIGGALLAPKGSKLLGGTLGALGLGGTALLAKLYGPKIADWLRTKYNERATGAPGTDGYTSK